MIKVREPEGGDFKQPKTGMVPAVCYAVADLGVQDTQFGSKHKIVIIWELQERMDDNRRFSRSRIYTASLHKKAALRADLEGWRGKPFTADELRGFDVEALVGVNCTLHLMLEDEKVIIKNVLPPTKGVKLVPENTDLPGWVKEMQKKGAPVADEYDQTPQAGSVIDDQDQLPF